MGIIFIIPYLQLQLTGLGMIVEVASYGAIHRTPAMIVSGTPGRLRAGLFQRMHAAIISRNRDCLLYTSPSPRD